jgi:hypothetical protein
MACSRTALPLLYTNFVVRISYKSGWHRQTAWTPYLRWVLFCNEAGRLHTTPQIDAFRTSRSILRVNFRIYRHQLTEMSTDRQLSEWSDCQKLTAEFDCRQRRHVFSSQRQDFYEYRVIFLCKALNRPLSAYTWRSSLHGSFLHAPYTPLQACFAYLWWSPAIYAVRSLSIIHLQPILWWE